MAKVFRTRNFASVLYPDSDNTPEDWVSILATCKVPLFISPLHDQDINPTGEPKKPHHHILLCFDGVKTVEQAKEVFDLVGCVGCEVVGSIRGYSRYLCHLDNPEKAQYPINQVLSYGGADYSSVCDLPKDKYSSVMQMREFIVDNHLHSYCQLLDYAAENRFDWFKTLCDYSACNVILKEYIKSYTWSDKMRSMIGEEYDFR